MRLMQTHAHIGHIYVFQLLNFSIKINVDFIKKKKIQGKEVFYLATYWWIEFYIQNKKLCIVCLEN